MAAAWLLLAAAKLPDAFLVRFGPAPEPQWPLAARALALAAALAMAATP